jgi:16S rRNA (cytidine1402-2'-O)-methyltransferase
MSEKGTLYVVGTPIGNLSDTTQRARDILSRVDLILCEDTRVTAKLLARLEIQNSTESLHQHTDEKKFIKISDRLKSGENIALVSDAGTPNISDPGGKFVEFLVGQHVDIIPIPGASALTAALSVCGFPADKFTFLGFPPHKKGRNGYFDHLTRIEHTIVLYESKHRIIKTLEQLPQDRKLMVGREITKMHETLYRGTASEIIELLEKSSTKGEFVIVLAPSK